ncbi:hypothetical protein, conserved [Trypanosoma brucei brucei TREU927]|uniref:TFIIH basal transcription factor subunit n=1 Tax=Trypanosoma brucei brucei (strain 927/4 GUTat10.1) TaxID=185431 RepID=Q4GZB0_TRYB2|nr:hypothetical protein, conserved [Trypanosoma brucei brucei TREU927]CAJ16045.1 hypothetical protein, conserved [Trypanosoma brucei brucei TREU927]
MSQLSELLNTSQLTKYYALIQFLSSHTNTEYTLAQLDYLLPRGASLQRFPASWIEFMEEGLCNNQNVELYRRPVAGGEAAGENISSLVQEEREEIVLICRRPVINDLKDLARLLQSPATVPDVEGCVALHTDQITLNENLLRASQTQGLLYYFPDNYTKSREHRSAKSRRSSSQSEIVSNLMRNEDIEGLLNEESKDGKLDLPAGVTAQFMLYNRRGVPVRGRNSFPMRYNVGDRAMVIVERSVPPDADHVPAKPPLVTTTLGRPVGMSSVGGSDGSTPVEIRVKVSANSVGSQRTCISIKAQVKGRVVLSLFVDSRETIIPLEVLDESVGMPGVIVGREQQPLLPVPDDIRINDPAIWGSGNGDEQAGRGGVSGIDRDSGSCGNSALSWWLNPSPAILEVRDLTLPDSETFAAASRAVWNVHRADESAMKAVRKALKDQRNSETTRKKRNKRSRPRDLRNSHMIHYGFDASIPFGTQRSFPKDA